MKSLKIPPFFPLALATLVPVLGGCGDSPVAGSGPDPKVEQAQVNDSLEIRKLFDKSGGDYSKLDATDKASLDKLAGSSAAAEKKFAEMKAGPDSGASAPNP